MLSAIRLCCYVFSKFISVVDLPRQITQSRFVLSLKIVRFLSLFLKHKATEKRVPRPTKNETNQPVTSEKTISVESVFSKYLLYERLDLGVPNVEISIQKFTF